MATTSAITTFENLEETEVRGDKTEMKQMPNRPELSYGFIGLKLNSRTLQIEFPLVTSRGIGVMRDEKTGAESLSCYWRLEDTKPEHLLARQKLTALRQHIGMNIIMPNKGAVGLPLFTCINPDGTFNDALADMCKFKRLVNYPKNKKTKAFNFDSIPGFAAKIIDWKYTKSVFIGLDSKEIPREMLMSGKIEIDHIPYVLFDSVYCGEFVSIQARLISSVVKAIRPAGESDAQHETLQRVANSDPDAVAKFEEQMAMLTMQNGGRSDFIEQQNSYNPSGISVAIPNVPSITVPVAPSVPVAQMQSISGSLPAQVNNQQTNVTSDATQFLASAPSRNNTTPPITQVTVTPSTDPSPTQGTVPTQTTVSLPPQTAIPQVTSVVSPTQNPIPQVTSMPSPTQNPIPQVTSMPSPTQVAIPTPTSMPSPTQVAVPTPTSIPSPTQVAVPTPTSIPSPTQVAIPTPTSIPSPTQVAIPTSVPMQAPQMTVPTSVPMQVPQTQAPQMTVPTSVPMQAPQMTVPTSVPMQAPQMSIPTSVPMQAPQMTVPTSVPMQAPQMSIPNTTSQVTLPQQSTYVVPQGQVNIPSPNIPISAPTILS